MLGMGVFLKSQPRPISWGPTDQIRYGNVWGRGVFQQSQAQSQSEWGNSISKFGRFPTYPTRYDLQ